MKSFWAALLIFGLMLVAITVNHIYITRACEELAAEIESLPPCENAAAPTQDLLRHWEGGKKCFGLSVSKGTVEKMTLCVEELAHAASCGDTQLFEGARIRAVCLLREIWNAESLLAENWI